MKRSFATLIGIFAVMLFAGHAEADQKYVQSSGNSVFTIDREAGTITRQIRANVQGGILQSETLSCKYGYIVTINGEAVAMLDLLAPLNGSATNTLAIKRVEWARKDCLQYNIEARF